MRVVITSVTCVLSGIFGGLATNDFNVVSAISIGLIAICMTLEIVGDRIVEAIEALREGKATDVDGHVCKEPPLAGVTEKGDLK